MFDLCLAITVFFGGKHPTSIVREISRTMPTRNVHSVDEFHDTIFYGQSILEPFTHGVFLDVL